MNGEVRNTCVAAAAAVFKLVRFTGDPLNNLTIFKHNTTNGCALQLGNIFSHQYLTQLPPLIYEHLLSPALLGVPVALSRFRSPSSQVSGAEQPCCPWVGARGPRQPDCSGPGTGETAGRDTARGGVGGSITAAPHLVAVVVGQQTGRDCDHKLFLTFSFLLF